MKFIRQIVYFAILLTSTLSAFSQSITDNKLTWLDPNLYNGKIYNFSSSTQIKGSPFLFSNENSSENFIIGKIRIKNNEYSDLLINYDIYAQKLLLKFNYLNSGKKIIEISDVWLSAFSVGNKKFIVDSIAFKKNTIFQVIGNQDFKIYYYWSKRMELKSSVNSYYHYFTKAQRKNYLKTQNQIIEFKNNKSFIKLFEKQKAESLKKFIKKENLNIKKINDTQMLKLITFCNTKQ